MMMGSLFGLHETIYSMDSMTVSGDSLYLVKMDVYYAPNIPIPERGADVVLKKDYEVVKLDLSGKKQRLSSTSYHLMPKRPPNDDSLGAGGYGYYGYIELDDRAQATLWGKPELKERLFKGIKTDCAVDEMHGVEYDGQDARVLYLYCPRTDTAYRFELPDMNVVAIPFGRPHNPESPNPCPTFYSVRGQKAIFANVNGVMYELNTNAPDSRKKMEMLERGFNSSKRSEKSLIGVAQGLRIYQVQQPQTNSVQLSIEYIGQPARLFPLPTAMVDMFGPVVYLPQSNLVFWDSWFEDQDYHIIYTFNIETSVMRRAKIPK